MWFKIEIEQAGWVTLQFTPLQQSDLDFVVFRSYTGGCGKLNAIRCSGASPCFWLLFPNVPVACLRTGLSPWSLDFSEGGVKGWAGDGWVADFWAPKNAVYFIMVDDFWMQRGKVRVDFIGTTAQFRCSPLSIPLGSAPHRGPDPHTEPCRYFDLVGREGKEPLAPGMWIKHCGTHSEKIVVK